MGARRYPDRPIVGVGAVIVDEDRVLLVERPGFHAPRLVSYNLTDGTLAFLEKVLK